MIQISCLPELSIRVKVPTKPLTKPDNNIAVRATIPVQPQIFVIATVSELSNIANSVAKPTPIEVWSLIPNGILRKERDLANLCRI